GERPNRVLPRAARSEVRPRDQDRGAAVASGIQHEIGILGAVRPKAPVEEKPLLESAAHDRFQELLGNDLVGVDVGAVERRHQAGEIREWTHRLISLPRPFADIDEMTLDRSGGGHHRAYQVGAAALALSALEITV